VKNDKIFSCEMGTMNLRFVKKKSYFINHKEVWGSRKILKILRSIVGFKNSWFCEILKTIIDYKDVGSHKKKGYRLCVSMVNIHWI